MTGHLSADDVVDIEAGTAQDYFAKWADFTVCETCVPCNAMRQSLKETEGRNRRDRIVAAVCAVEDDMECHCPHEGFHCRFFVGMEHPDDCEECYPEADPDRWRD